MSFSEYIEPKPPIEDKTCLLKVLLISFFDISIASSALDADMLEHVIGNMGTIIVPYLILGGSKCLFVFIIIFTIYQEQWNLNNSLAYNHIGVLCQKIIYI